MATPRVGALGVGTTKGDLFVVDANGDLERVPVGADGLYVTADSTSALGISYKTGANRAMIMFGGANMGAGDTGKYFGVQDTSNGGKNNVLSSDNQMSSGITGTIDRFTFDSQTADATTVFKIWRNGLVVATFSPAGTSGAIAVNTPVTEGDLIALEYDSGQNPGRTTVQVWARR